MRPEPRWKPGDAVILYQTLRNNRGYGKKEYGRVIDSFWDYKHQWYNVYVAFYGFKMPKNHRGLKRKPYVLRYLETTLRAYEPKKRK